MFQFFTAVQRLIAFFQRKMLNWRMDRRTTGQTDRQIDNGGFIRPSVGRGPRKIRNLVKILLLIFINKSSRLPHPPSHYQIRILDNLLEYLKPHQHIHLKKMKASVIVNLKYFCLPVGKFDLLKIQKSLFNLFCAPN